MNERKKRAKETKPTAKGTLSQEIKDLREMIKGKSKRLKNLEALYKVLYK